MDFAQGFTDLLIGRNKEVQVPLSPLYFVKEDKKSFSECLKATLVSSEDCLHNALKLCTKLSDQTSCHFHFKTHHIVHLVHCLTLCLSSWTFFFCFISIYSTEESWFNWIFNIEHSIFVYGFGFCTEWTVLCFSLYSEREEVLYFR